MAEIPCLDESIKNYFAFNVKLFSFFGLDVNSEIDKKARKSRFPQKLLIYLPISQLVFFGYLEIVFLVELMRDKHTTLAIETCGQMLTNVLCLNKGYRLVRTSAKVKRILQDLSTIWKTYLTDNRYRKNICRTASQTLLFCKAIFVAAMVASVAFFIPTFQHIALQYIHREENNHTMDFSRHIIYLKYPFEITGSVTYILLNLVEMYAIICSATFYTCCNTLFVQLTTHVSLQFQVLQYDVEKLIDSVTNDARLQNNLILFVKRHNKLLSICDQLENIFSPVVFISILVSAVNMCLNVYGISETLSGGDYAAAIRFAFLTQNTFIDIAIYCVFAEILTKQTSIIANGIYNCKWTENNVKFRIFFQMLIHRSQKPFYCTAYGFFPIGHKQLTTVINTTFSYYMMLRATT